MSIKSIGMAIKITKDNCEKIAVVNGGIVPKIEEVITYFYFPYDYDSSCQILSEEVFKDNYRFNNLENDKFFVDVDEI